MYWVHIHPKAMIVFVTLSSSQVSTKHLKILETWIKRVCIYIYIYVYMVQRSNFSQPWSWVSHSTVPLPPRWCGGVCGAGCVVGGVWCGGGVVYVGQYIWHGGYGEYGMQLSHVRYVWYVWYVWHVWLVWYVYMVCLECMVCLVCMAGMVCMECMVGIVVVPGDPYHGGGRNTEHETIYIYIW